MECAHEPPAPTDRGFSLVELLVVIVVIGILATVVVLSVRGIADRGEESTLSIDAREITTAMEAYQSRYGVYPTEDVLVSAGLLREESTRHDITVSPDGMVYTISTVP